MDATTTVNLSPMGLALIGLAATLLPPLLLYGLQSWSASRKDKRDSERKLSEAAAIAQLQAEKEKRDYARQDEVAARAEKVAEQQANVAKQLADAQAQAAKQVAEAAAELVKTQHAAIIRQDQVASKVVDAAATAANAAELLKEAQEETKRRTDEVALAAAQQDKRVWDQLITIGEVGEATHILVNSDMTTARTNERDTLKMLVIALRQLLLINEKDGRDQSKEKEEITRVEKRIEELTQILADRRAAQAIVDNEHLKNVSRKSQDAAAILDKKIAFTVPAQKLPGVVATGDTGAAQSKAPMEVVIVNPADKPVPVEDTHSGAGRLTASPREVVVRDPKSLERAEDKKKP